MDLDNGPPPRYLFLLFVLVFALALTWGSLSPRRSRVGHIPGVCEAFDLDPVSFLRPLAFLFLAGFRIQRLPLLLTGDQLGCSVK